MESLRIALTLRTRDPGVGKDSLPLSAVGEKAGATGSWGLS